MAGDERILDSVALKKFRDAPGESAAERLTACLGDASRVLFLCSGNIIRSAYCELLARHLGCPVPVLSAATTYDNDALYGETRAALTQRGVPAATLGAFRPTMLERLPVQDERVLVLGMTPDHLTALAGTALEPLRERAFLLPLVADEYRAVEDPMFTGEFAQTFDVLTRYVQVLVRRLGEQRR